jgi:hypothetical protein
MKHMWVARVIDGVTFILELFFFITLGWALIISLPFQYYIKTIVVQFCVFLEIHWVWVLEDFMRLALVLFFEKNYLLDTWRIERTLLLLGRWRAMDGDCMFDRGATVLIYMGFLSTFRFVNLHYIWWVTL